MLNYFQTYNVLNVSYGNINSTSRDSCTTESLHRDTILNCTTPFCLKNTNSKMCYVTANCTNVAPREIQMVFMNQNSSFLHYLKSHRYALMDLQMILQVGFSYFWNCISAFSLLYGSRAYLRKSIKK